MVKMGVGFELGKARLKVLSYWITLMHFGAGGRELYSRTPIHLHDPQRGV